MHAVTLLRDETHRAIQPSRAVKFDVAGEKTREVVFGAADDAGTVHLNLDEPGMGARDGVRDRRRTTAERRHDGHVRPPRLADAQRLRR